jgi:hypothetical protein
MLTGAGYIGLLITGRPPSSRVREWFTTSQMIANYQLMIAGKM